MKYVISDRNEINIGPGYHSELARDFEGKVVRAGHCEKLADGKYKVWGESIGYGIGAMSEDAKILSGECKVEEPCAVCGGTGEVEIMERVYPGEPHTAPIGSQKCMCILKEPFIE